MAASNDITGDDIKSRPSSQMYRDNWDRIFGKKKQEPDEKQQAEAFEPQRVVVARCDIPTRNNRRYTREVLESVVEQAAKLSESHGVTELNDDASVNLDKITHSITDFRMEGDELVATAKRLNTPAGLKLGDDYTNFHIFGTGIVDGVADSDTCEVTSFQLSGVHVGNEDIYPSAES